ncbi:threonylcarbamoyl-AMP synthase [Candidatus Micrarchaeota archaeon]|nr:threonylcarbamoyl-AMP synthase [Candidatus Micrarchaeota archaeon]
MNIINLDSWSSYGKASDESLKAISAGEMIIYPTDTLYGIGANATDANAVSTVNEAKRRENKPISVLVSDFSMMKKYCLLDNVSFAILQHLFPGPVTGIFRKKYDFPSGITKTDTIAIRIPCHQFAVSLVRKLGFPITSTSANFSGAKSPSSLDEIPDELKEIAKVVVDGGRCHHGIESTIVDFTLKVPEIIREGAGSESIEEILKDTSLV